MPLKVMDVVDQRLRIVTEIESGRLSVTDAALLFEVSRSTLHDWLARYRVGGASALVPRSRRPLSSPATTLAALEDEIVRVRKDRNGRWGAKKIRAFLTEQGFPMPATSTVHQILLRRGLVQPPTARANRDPGRRFERPFSNDLWQIDGTQHRLVNGREFWVVDVIDDHSRFLLAALVGPSLTGALGWQALRTATAAYGLPRQLLSDNGLSFTGRLHGVAVCFERQVRSAGIEFLHSRVYHPQTQGKLERQHGTQNAWLADHRPRSLTQAQAILRRLPPRLQHRAPPRRHRPTHPGQPLPTRRTHRTATHRRRPRRRLPSRRPHPPRQRQRPLQIRHPPPLTSTPAGPNCPSASSATTAGYTSTTAAPTSSPSSSVTCHTRNTDNTRIIDLMEPAT